MSQATVQPRPAKTPPYYLEKERNVKPCPPDRYAEIGMVVQHYPDARKGATPTCAIVMKLGIETIDCNIVHPSLGTMVPYSGVHHLDYQVDKIDGEGAWRPLDMNVAILKFMIASGALVWDGESRYIQPPEVPAPGQPTAPEKKVEPIA